MNVIWKLLLVTYIIQAVCTECQYISGPEVIVRVLAKDSIPDSVLYVSCDHNSTTFDLSLLQNCSFPFVTIARFDYCVLNDSLKSTLAVLGVNVGRVKEIVLSAPKVEHLDSNLLQGLSNLTSFIVYNGMISSVSEEAFIGVPNLTRLILNDNLFEKLPSRIFWNITHLKVLIINRQIQTLQEDVFSRSVNLEILHLHSNKLRSLFENIFSNLTSLKTLSLSNNQIKYVNGTIFRNCGSLEHLNLKKNDLETIPDLLLANSTKLESIDFSQNQILSIPQNIFGNNENLRKIDFSNNLLSNIPETLISQLSKLENISFSENRINSLPATFLRKSATIISLDLKGNNIENIPTEFFSKSYSISVIDISENNLTVLPDNAFISCISLEKLKLNNNNLSIINSNQFPPPTATKLKEINLSNNEFSLSGIFGQFGFALTNQILLNHLDLSYNNIEQMPYALYTLINLATLNLEKNNITFFSLEFLREIISREVVVNVRSNSIKTIAAKIFYPLEINAKILVSGNPLNCDCNMYDFAKFLNGEKRFAKNVEIEDANDLLCVQPVTMNNKQLKAVDVNKLTCHIPAMVDSQCSTMCDCVIQPSYQRIVVDCSDRNLTEVPPLTMNVQSQSYVLSVDISSNSLTSFNFSHPAFSIMTNLSLANNSINDSSMHELLPELPNQLRFLNISANNATRLEESFLSFIDNTSLSVDLSGSHWTCDCSLKPLRTFLQSKYSLVYNVRDVYCYGYNEPLIDLTAEDVCLGSRKLATIILLPLIAIIVAILGTIAFFRYQTSMRVWLYSKRATRWLVTEKDIDADKMYDAFISYSHEDEDFVNETLVAGLENGDQKYEVCLHYRDWRPGELIQSQILESVANSRRTIVILSKNFINSVWGKMEFRVAHQKALKDNTNRVIVIVYGEMPPLKMLDDELKHYVNTRTYLNYDNSRFWDNLRYAMPHKPDTKKRNQIKLDNINGPATVK